MKLRLLFALLFSTFAFAQTATLTGVILDKEMYNDPLPFANVMIKGTKIGTTTNEKGNYILTLKPGSYTLVVGYLGYDTKEIPFMLKDNEKKIINQTLESNGIQLDDVVVVQTVSKEKESALLLEQQKSVEIKQRIGAEEIAKKGISDVATAVAKTTGVSKQEGTGHIYGRGLGDRYISTSINNLPIPSNNPEKKNIDLALFSTDIVEYISIDKVYSSRTSGDFAGGNIDITSKIHKGKGLLELSIGSSVNTNALGKSNEFTLQSGPNVFGYTNYGVPNNALNGYNFKNSLKPTNEMPFGGNIGLKAGKSFDVGKEGKLSLFASAGFENNYEYREGINQNINAQAAEVKSFNQEHFSYKTTSTGLFNTNYKFNKNHSLGFNLLYVNSSDQSRDTYTGYERDYDQFDNILVQRGTYVQNRLMVNQLVGSNKITDAIDLDWGTSYSTINSDMPDRVQNKLGYLNSSNGYVFAQNTITDNNRYFQNLTENEIAGNVVMNYKFNSDEEGKFKAKFSLGYNGRVKKRDFKAIQYNFRMNATQLNTVVDPDNLDVFFNQTNYANNLFTIESFAGNTPQTYEGEQNIHAGFVNLEYHLSENLSAIVGLRVEKVEQSVSWRTQLDFSGRKNTFNRNEIFPNLMLKYALNEKQNLRLGASKTYTLPQFKERALFIYEDVTEVKIGNPDLYPSQNYNLDFKWELFPQTDEVISATAFGKYILDPINETLIASATNDISFMNTGDNGYVYGVEVEIRKKIFNFNDTGDKLSAGFNASLMKTHQDLDSKKVRDETDYNVNLTHKTASFTGASDLLLNADITYNKNWKDGGNIMGTLAYSYYSDRLYSLGIEQKGNLVDKGMGTLDFILKTKLTKNFGINLTAKNILNPNFRRVQENANSAITVVNYKRGAYLNLGANYSF